MPWLKFQETSYKWPSWVQSPKPKVQGFWPKSHQFFSPILGQLPEKFPEEQTLKPLLVSQCVTAPAFFPVYEIKDVHIICCGIKWGRVRTEIAGRDYNTLFWWKEPLFSPVLPDPVQTFLSLFHLLSLVYNTFLVIFTVPASSKNLWFTTFFLYTSLAKREEKDKYFCACDGLLRGSGMRYIVEEKQI